MGKELDGLDQQKELQEWLKDKISNVSNLDREEIDIHAPFSHYGLDSAEGLVLLGEIEEKLNKHLSPTLLWEYPNIHELSCFLTLKPQTDIDSVELDQINKENKAIAIVGMGCRFPGAPNLEAYWQLLSKGVDAITKVPPDRFPIEDFYDPKGDQPGTTVTQWGGFLEEIDQFDPYFFGITPKEAERMDPQQRILMEVAWQALEDAGIPIEQLSGSKTGVFVGISTNEYAKRQFSDPKKIDPYYGTGNALSIVANRLSYFLNLSGPSVAVDTACSSSLVALHLACQSLRNGESQLAIAGGVNFILLPDLAINFSQSGVMAKDGRCKTFDERADGYVRSEGGGVVILKPLSQALADGDRIYGVVLGSAVNQDGRSNGLMAPNGKAQEEVLREVYQKAGVSPGEVTFIETHGTGTSLGDAIEVKALQEVMKQDRPPEHPCLLGSVKTNIGHLESAAGIAGFIKVALSIWHGKIPPNLHFEKPNPHFGIEETAFNVPTELTEWPSTDAVRLAGVSSFGFGGTNCHIVLQGNLHKEVVGHDEPKQPLLLPLSAKDPQALKELMQLYCEKLSKENEIPLKDLVYTAATRRTHFDYRYAAVGSTPQEIVEQLQQRMSVKQDRKRNSQVSSKIAYVFSGQGSQWMGMGRILYRKFPLFKEVLQQCDELIRTYVDGSVIDVLFDDEAEYKLHESEWNQPILFAIQVAMASLWRSWGIEPSAIVGHSMGEVAAAYMAGALRLDEAIQVIIHRGKVMQKAIGQGKMISTDLSVQEALELIGGQEDQVSIAAINGSHSIILSGDPDRVETIHQKLNSEGRFCRYLKVNLASHSPQMEEPKNELVQVLHHISPMEAEIPLYSTVTGKKNEILDASYWGSNLREPVLFSPVIEELVADGYECFIEVSPHPVLISSIKDIVRDKSANGLALPSTIRNENEWSVLFSSLAELYQFGQEIDWKQIYPVGNIIDLPHYPWQKERYWMDEPSQVRYENKDSTAIWDQMIRDGKRQSEQGPFDLALQTYQERTKLFEELTISYVIQTCHQLGIFVLPEEKRTIDEILQDCNIQLLYRKLFLRWLDQLVSNGYLQRVGDVYQGMLPQDYYQPSFYLNVLRSSYPDLSDLLDYIERSGENLGSVLRGEISPLELYFLNGSFQTAEMVYQHLPESRYFNHLVQSVIQSVIREQPTQPHWRLLEVGAGTGATTASILPVLPTHRFSYHFTDLSEMFLQYAKHKFQDEPIITEIFDVEKNPEEQGYKPHSFDLIIASNVIHATRDLKETLANIQKLLVPGGMLVMWEVTTPQPWFDITFGLIEGWQRFEDDLRKNSPLIRQENWEEILAESGFQRVKYFPEESSLTNVLGQHIFIAQASDSFKSKSTDSYLPLNKKGSESEDEQDELNPKTTVKDILYKNKEEQRLKVERYLLDLMTEIIGTRKQIPLDESIQMLGIDSLMAVQLRNRLLHDVSFEIAVGDLLQGITIRELKEQILSHLEVSNEEQTEKTAKVIIHPNPMEKHKPFPLNEIQQAYWFGRSNKIELGNVSTQLYLEFDLENLDYYSLTQAWNHLMKRHDMLRAIVEPNGQQRILDEVPLYQIPLIDLRELDDDEKEQRLKDARETLSRAVRVPEQWPLFDISVHQLSEKVCRIHFAIDFLIADAKSLMILFEEWKHYYHQGGELTPLQLSFRDYVLTEAELQQTQEYQESLKYWLDRLPTLPEAPTLPLKCSPKTIKKPKFRRYSHTIEPNMWQHLKEKASQVGVTPSMFLCAAYAEILGYWSKNDAFTLNVTLFNRIPFHPEVDQIIGDFTALNLLEVDHTQRKSFIQRAKQLQIQLMEDLKHSQVSGVRVLRELGKLKGQGLRAAMPVVFTSVLEDFKKRFDWLGQMIYGISQTPQVWLDHQVYEESGSLVLVWDAIEELFPDGMLQDMFNAYCRFLQRLATDEESWIQTSRDFLSEEQLHLQQQMNHTDVERPLELMYQSFEFQAHQNKNHPAIITADGTRITYQQLQRYSNQLGHGLREFNAKPNQLVAIVMEKGWEQIVAVLGILKAGAAYLPIDPDLPTERIQYLLEVGQVDLVVTQPWIEQKIVWPDPIKRIFVSKEVLNEWDDSALVPQQRPDDLAYVIFTSGSTGVPKGVMIDHIGAINTIKDLNNRFSVGAEDKVLALSSLSFDLSVYDIFGVLSAGGTVILPEHTRLKDPTHWIDLMNREKVTIWNSVPALLSMLVEYVDGKEMIFPVDLRLTLMSGDWIPLPLAKRLVKERSDLKVMSLGGATEASIWSILYPISQVKEEWTSIPYGTPMENQRFYVLNHHLEPCPIWSPGQLYIGGLGLAKGYWSDEDKTKESFIIHPVTGERLYKTGDLGRYLPDGNIEFLGREDFQVKIQGYRIELGEIEHQLQNHPLVHRAIVNTMTLASGEKALIGYVITKNSKQILSQMDLDQILEFLKQHLPTYMVPQELMQLEKIPLTPNGKVHRDALPLPEKQTNKEYIAPRTALEKRIEEVWCKVLGLERISITDNFFTLGGNSVNSIQVVVQLQKVGYTLLPQQLFDTGTIAELAVVLETNTTGRKDQERKHPSHLTVPNIPQPNRTRIHRSTDPKIEPASILLTGVTGYLGIYLLREILNQTSAQVYCLVRALNPADAKKRIAEQINWYFSDQEIDQTRIQVVVGDLTQPNLGISDPEYKQLAEEVDIIYHSAAEVKYIGDYEHFYAINVFGTEQIVQLAKQGKSKYIHHISTVGVRGTSFDLQDFTENDFDLGQTLDTSYAKTKFLAEKVIRDAMSMGCQATIHRIGFVAADFATGKFQRNMGDNAMYRYMKAVINTGIAPYLPDVKLDFTPVDFVAQAIVRMSLKADLYGQTTHITNPTKISHYDWIRTLQAMGYSIRLLDLEQYDDVILSLIGEANISEELGSLVQFGDVANTLILNVNSEETHQYYQMLDLQCPQPTSAWLQKMIQDAIQKGYIDSPQRWNECVIANLIS